jgi:hypothetical protein
MDHPRPFDDRTAWSEQTGLITLLPEPPTNGSHLSIFLDQQPNDTFIIYVFSREVNTAEASNKTHRMTHNIHRFSLTNEKWTCDETNISNHISLYNARLTVQIPYTYSFDHSLAGTVFFFGGENTITDMFKVTSHILQYNPKTNIWRHVSHMPQLVFGVAGVLLRDSNQIILVGGASGWVGEKVFYGRPCYRDVYLYTLPSEEQMTRYMENTKKYTLFVIAAHFGHLDVTHKVKELVEQKQIREFDVKIFVESYLRDYVTQYWTSRPQWSWYEGTLTILMFRNGYLVSMPCPYIYSLCILTN